MFHGLDIGVGNVVVVVLVVVVVVLVVVLSPKLNSPGFTLREVNLCEFVLKGIPPDLN